MSDDRTYLDGYFDGKRDAEMARSEGVPVDLRFAKALTEYGVHHGNCDSESWDRAFSRCKCGLFRLIKDADRVLREAAK